MAAAASGDGSSAKATNGNFFAKGWYKYSKKDHYDCRLYGEAMAPMQRMGAYC